MIGMKSTFEADFEDAKFDVVVPKFKQEMSEAALCKIIGEFDGWIIGDDPATKLVVETGAKGKLKACMRWGVGTDNVDFSAFKKYSIPIENTPGVFGQEVADLAMHYVTSLARETYKIDREVKNNNWYKPIGRSLWNCRALIVGLGDIGNNLAKRLNAHSVTTMYYDPHVKEADIKDDNLIKVEYAEGLNLADFVIFTAPLNRSTRHMFNLKTLSLCKSGVKLVNVGRGPLIDERALICGLDRGIIEAAALDVFEVEPFSTITHQDLNKYADRLILGSHNGSNTFEAVEKVSKICIQKLRAFLNKRHDV